MILTYALDPFLGVRSDQILQQDKTVHRKQRHTKRRIFERLRDEHGYPGGYTVVATGARVTSAPCAPVLTLVRQPSAGSVSVRVTPGGTCPA